MRTRSRAFLVSCAIFSLFALPPAATLRAYDDSGHQKDKAKAAKHDGKAGTAHVESDAWMDHAHCRVVVSDYYDRHGLPPGLAKKGSLPPGLRKQLRERGHLPPGLEKHMVAVPVQLEHDLPPLPPHHASFFVDSDLIVVDVRTNFVVSIVAGVFIRH